MVGKDTVIINHRYVSADQHPSPHHDERPDDEICLIVIHCISLPEAHFGSRYIDDLFMGRHHDGAHPELDELSDLKVSAHIVIDREGGVTQYVPFDRRAWHAGESVYAGRTRCNDFSIGIELVGTDHHAYSEVPTGIKMGVGTSPWAVCRRPARAELPGSWASTSKSIGQN